MRGENGGGRYGNLPLLSFVSFVFQTPRAALGTASKRGPYRKASASSNW